MGYGVLSMSHGVICLAWHPLLLRKVYTVQGVAQTLKTGNHAGRTKGKRTKTWDEQERLEDNGGMQRRKNDARWRVLRGRFG